MQKNNKIFVFILSIFIFPLIASWILFHYHTHFHLKTTNHGTLIQTPVDITFLETVPKKWHILYVTDKTCATDCQEINHQLQQVQKALGKNQDRVITLSISPKNAGIQKLQILLSQQNPSFVVSHKIYLADPLGNLFMYYPDTTDPMNILKDLQHLLEVSQIG
jgi:cytochrome oxidase Cu insertion factor (SCO1/SenC/PrrC family)